MKQEQPVQNERLYKALLKLSNVTIKKVLKHKDEGKLKAIPHQYLPATDFDYSMSTYRHDWEKVEYFDFYEWYSLDFVTFMKEELLTLTEFEEAAQYVIDEYKVPDNAVKNIGLPTLLRSIMKSSPNGEITTDNVSSYVQLFIDGYNGYRNHTPVIWNVDLWLGNIYIEAEEIEIDKGVFLRRPTEEQMGIVEPKPIHVSEFERLGGRSLAAGAILSFSIAAGSRPLIGLYPEKILNQIERWLTIFRLFKPADLTVVYQSANPDSIFEYSISENKEQPQDKFWRGKVEHKETSTYKLYISVNEETMFKAFIQSIKPALKDISHKNYLSGSSYDLAFHRYSDSLLKSEVNAYKILSAITSLESLLSDGSAEISFKIRLRVAKLLSLLGLKPLEVSENVKTAYSLRSKLVHGSNPEDNNKDLLEFAREHTHEILNYNRLCLIIGLQVKKSYDKTRLIKLIDNSFIDSEKDILLKKLIDEKVKISIIDPFPKIIKE